MTVNSLEDNLRHQPNSSKTTNHFSEGDGCIAESLEPWQSLLHDAGPSDHIVQLYQDEEFLSRAVCRFAAAALAHGEGVILVPTAAHWEAFCPRLEAEWRGYQGGTVARSAHSGRR